MAQGPHSYCGSKAFLVTRLGASQRRQNTECGLLKSTNAHGAGTDNTQAGVCMFIFQAVTCAGHQRHIQLLRRMCLFYIDAASELPLGEQLVQGEKGCLFL